MKNNFDVRLGQALRKARIRKRLRQPYIAELMNVSKMTISHWETGKRSMTAENLSRYCKILGVTVQQIFDEMEDGDE